MAPSETPRSPVAPLSASEDLDVAWKKTVDRCQRIGNWNLSDKSKLSVDDVIAKINPPKDKSNPQLKDNARTVFRNALVCIQRFGGIVAQAASTVFGPSQQCFNAISFVISVSQDYSEVFDNLIALMERLSAFMEKLRSYLDDPRAEEKLDQRLRPSVYQVLDFFLEIMSKAYKLTKGWRSKGKLIVKLTLFKDDGGVKDSLGKLEDLISRVTQTEITVIYKNLSDAARDIRDVDQKLDQLTSTFQAAEHRRANAEKQSKEIALLRKVLVVEDKKDRWQDAQDEKLRLSVRGSGQWLLKFRMPPVARWLDPIEGSTAVITLRAEQKCGKSFLCSTIIDHLLTIHRDNPYVCVAYFFFDKDTPNDRGGDTVNKAIKSIIWQLTQSNKYAGQEYLRLAAKVCNETPDISKTIDLWNEFVNEQMHSLTATFYIVLDGLDESEAEQGKPLARIVDQLLGPAKEGARLAIRLFVAGRPAGLEALQKQVDIRLPEIDLTSSTEADVSALNEDDLLLFAEDRLNEISIFQEPMSLERRDLKERVKTTLTRGAHGNYYRLESNLDDISDARYPDQIEQILRRANESLTEMITRQISQLNETLAPDEIQDVNNLLMWVILAYGRISVGLLENVLLLNRRTAQSLVPLEKQIRERYSVLFAIDEEEIEVDPNDCVVEMRSDSTKDFLSRQDDKMDDRRNTFLQPTEQRLEEAEMALIERTIKTHLGRTFGDGPDMFKKYQLEEFFESKRKQSADLIHFYAEQAEIALAQSCLVAVCDKNDDPEYSRLYDYGFSYFADHLRNQIKRFDLDDIDPVVKQDIGRKLVRLLHEDSLIARWKHAWVEERVIWLKYTELCNAILAWLKDTTVQNGLQDMPAEKEWVRYIISRESSSSVVVLEKVAAAVARRWFEAPGEAEFDAETFRESFEWTWNFYNQLDDKPYQYTYYRTASVTDIRNLVSLCQASLKNEQESDSWQFCTALTLRHCDHLTDSINELVELVKRNTDFRFQYELALAYCIDDQIPEAVKTMEALIESNKALLDSDERYTDKYWTDMLPLLSDWNIATKRFEAAEDVGTRLLEKGLRQDGFVSYAREAAHDLIIVRSRQEKYAQVLTTISELFERSDADDGNCLTYLLKYYAFDVELHDAIFPSIRHSDKRDTIIKAYKDALLPDHIADSNGSLSEQLPLSPSSGDETNEIETEIEMALNFHLGRILWYYGSPEESTQAVKRWERIVRTESAAELWDSSDSRALRRSSLFYLAPALLTMANRNGLGSPVASRYILRLEALAAIDNSVLRKRMLDARLILARYYHLSMEQDKARNTVRGYLNFALRIARRSGADCEEGFKRLAFLFQIFNNDDNALAAWSFFTPDKNSDSCEDSKETNQSAVKLQNKTIASTETKDASEQADQARHDDAPHAAVVNGQVESETTRRISEAQQLYRIDTSNPVNKLKDETIPPVAHVENVMNTSGSPHPDNSPPALERAESNDTEKEDTDIVCDSCKQPWNKVDEIHACRDCLYLVLCSSCYPQLKEGTLSYKSCDQEHSHLRIPALEARIECPAGSVVVGKEVLLIKDWLDRIRIDWGLLDEGTARGRLINLIKKVQHGVRLQRTMHSIPTWSPGEIFDSLQRFREEDGTVRIDAF